MIMLGSLSSTLRGRAARVALKISLALGTALCAVGPLAMPAHAAGPVVFVNTAGGSVRGIASPTNPSVSTFLGIRYAFPPVSTNLANPACTGHNMRWCPPRAITWSGTRAATAFGPICAQTYLIGAYAGPPNSNEDCLYLNIWTPNANASANLPVIFWIHGGGNVDGETPGYDGTKMAAQGVVVVSIEYRMNLFGWLNIPSLGSEGNLGTLDQLFALKWVHSNITNFGGNPNNITVGGQSAGAQDTSVALISPAFAGLFQQGICESSCSTTLTPSSVAIARGLAFLSQFPSCAALSGAAQANCLRAIPAATIETMAGNGIFYTTQLGATGSTATGITQQTGNSPYITGPYQDALIPIQPQVAWQTGAFNHAHVMNGSVRDETNFSLNALQMFETTPSQRPPLTAAQYYAAITAQYTNPSPVPPALPFPPGTASAVLAHYPISNYQGQGFVNPAQIAWDTAGTDPGHCQNQNNDGWIGNSVPTYGYSFDDRTAPNYFPPMRGFQGLAYHTSDQQYLWPLWSGGPLGTPHALNSLQTNLSNVLVAAWTNFAKFGNPNGSVNTPWPNFHPSRQILSENVPLTTYSFQAYQALHQCSFWLTTFPYSAGADWKKF